MSKLIRQAHRWVSVAFTLTVVANFVAMGLGGGVAPPFITYAPLLPLALLLFSGLYLFVLPYATRWRSAGAARLGTLPDQQDREHDLLQAARRR